jgi:hypothetical protein
MNIETGYEHTQATQKHMHVTEKCQGLRLLRAVKLALHYPPTFLPLDITVKYGQFCKWGATVLTVASREG